MDQKERSIAQSHFNDLCELLEEPKPLEADPTGEWYAFEKGVTKTTGGDGWADVWKRVCFAWEYKGKHKDLDRAFAQLQQYSVALDNPPLLVVSDIERIRIVTNWTNTVSVRYDATLEDLLDPAKRDLLKKVFRGDESLRTGESRASLTQKVAREFAALAQELEAAGHDPLEAAHFVNRLVFCMFAEDAGLLRDHLFTEMLDAARDHPEEFEEMAKGLFAAMNKGGRVGFKPVDRFNGGLFDHERALPLTRAQIDRIRSASEQNWSAIDPSILGTLFERGLDPAKRAQLGAHYTDPENILRIVEPVVLRPLRREWDEAKAKIEGAKRESARREILQAYLERIRNVRVLDPACGSGNFLYIALRALKDLEHRVLLEAEALGLGRSFPELDQRVVHGIELNPYAAELARVTVWIGELQWQLEHGFNVDRNPVLKPLETIENRDALLRYEDGKAVEAEWPKADFIIGNPPFLGDKVMRQRIPEETLEAMRSVYAGRVPGGADLVCYWFAKAGEALQANGTRRVGLVSTNKIRKGKNNDVLRGALQGNPLFQAWSDMPWHDERGAAVRVSVLCFGVESEVASEVPSLDGTTVSEILPDFTPRTERNEVDLGLARPIPDNRSKSFNGLCLAGEFDVPETIALAWLQEPNPSGRPNSDVLRPLWNGRDLTDGWRGRWVLDFGPEMEEGEAARYAAPFDWVETHVKPKRLTNNEAIRRSRWWRLGRSRPELRSATAGLGRVLVTPETAKYRWFRWLGYEQAPEHKLVVVATDDDYIQGILSSRFHLLWAMRKGNWLGVGNDSVYAAQSTFLTFPFPDPTDSQREAIAKAARELDALRENWLNPPEWTEEETLVFPATPGGPWDRWIVDGEARYVRRVPRPDMKALVAARTLTKLYNERPAWLRHAHEALDEAVAAAYGWPADLADDEVLRRLLELNLSR